MRFRDETIGRLAFFLLSFLVGLVFGAKECKQAILGKDYQGQVAKTRTGKTCQPWTSQYPHEHKFKSADLFLECTLEDVHNFCRNPDNEAHGPWCYTTDRGSRWEYCDVPLCRQCRETVLGWEYEGNRAHTHEGRGCQQWNSQYPHKHSNGDIMKFPDGDMNGNYCRNPDMSPIGPWCYTSNIHVRWEACNVPLCTQCKQSEVGREYQGTIAVTRTGRKCQSWKSQYPHSHKFKSSSYFPDDSMSDVTNYCRNPDNEKGPWCYTTDSKVRWEFCDVPLCLQCKQTDHGQEYQGGENCTREGLKCQAWTSQHPHNHGFKTAANFPDDSLKEAANYCRNPDNEPEGPWCYTTDPSRRWQYCDVRYCKASYVLS